MSARLVKQPCAGCGVTVLHTVDVDTDEPLVLDEKPVDEGNVVVYGFNGIAVARRYGRPARVQPAWREHDCPTPTPVVPVAQPFDPYEDDPAAVQQHGGWRA